MRFINQSCEILTTLEEADAAVRRVEYAARNCYASQGKIDDCSYLKFVEGLIKRGHLAPLEFGQMTVELVTSRAVLAEITRHRLASYCVESQRYIQEAKTGDIDFIIPSWANDDRVDDFLDVKLTAAACENIYKLMILKGCSPQEAREVLPNCTACKIVMNANLREWRNIFELRCSTAAYPQMRELMTMLLKDAHDAFPVVFDDLYEKFIKL